MKIVLQLRRHERRLWEMRFPEFPMIDCGRPRDSLRKARRVARERLARSPLWHTPIADTEIVEEIVLPALAAETLERRRVALAAFDRAAIELFEATRDALREVIVNADVSYRDGAELFSLSRSRLSKLIGKIRLKGKAAWLRSIRETQLDFLARGGIGSFGLRPRMKRPGEIARKVRRG